MLSRRHTYPMTDLKIGEGVAAGIEHPGDLAAAGVDDAMIAEIGIPVLAEGIVERIGDDAPEIGAIPRTDVGATEAIAGTVRSAIETEAVTE